MLINAENPQYTADIAMSLSERESLTGASCASCALSLLCNMRLVARSLSAYYDISCRRLKLYPYHLQGQNSGLELLFGIATAIILQAFTEPSSYAQARLHLQFLNPLSCTTAECSLRVSSYECQSFRKLTSCCEHNHLGPSKEMYQPECPTIAVQMPMHFPLQVIILICLNLVLLLWLRLIRPAGDRTELIMAMLSCLSTLGIYICGLILLANPNGSDGFRYSSL